MKRENGTGTIIKLSGNRRKPWCAKVTDGYNEEGLPIQKIICNEKGEKYFKERWESEEALLWWNKNHNRINIDKLAYTFKELYDEWEAIYVPTKEERKRMREFHETIKGKLGLSHAMGLLVAVKKFKPLYNKRYALLKKQDFQQILNVTTGKRTAISNMRNLIMKLDEYAMGEDIITKGYGTLLELDYEESISERTPFTYEDIETIFKHKGELIADILLILLHTGMRIEELLIVEIKNINIEDGYLITGLKTKAGKNRLIPLHREILPIIKKYMKESNTYLFTAKNGRRLIYERYRDMYVEFMQNLNLKGEYTTHETRYTFRTELDRLHADVKCIDLIMGHESGNTGNKVYNKRTIEELKETVELINYRQKKSTKVTYLKLNKTA